MKVAELSGDLLDYWVAKADGRFAEIKDGICRVGGYMCFLPSSTWSQGGPIIEREEIQLVPRANGEHWAAGIDHFIAGGDTALIAAMRCFVLSTLGEDVPDAE